MATKETQNNTDTSQPAPIIIERRKSEPKERTTRLRPFQETEEHILDAIHRVTHAADHGISVYMKARDESVDKYGDEAFADILPNMAKGMQAVIETIAPLPGDIVGIFYPRRLRRSVEDTFRSFGNSMDDLDDDDDDVEASIKVSRK